MPNRYRVCGRLVHAKRHFNTRSGNAQWALEIRLNGGLVWSMRTRPDAQCAGLIESHHVGEYVFVTVEDSEIIGYEVIDRDSELRYSIEDLEPRYTIVDWL